MLGLGEENIGIEQIVLEAFCACETAFMVASTHDSHKVAIDSHMSSYRNTPVKEESRKKYFST